MKRKHMLIVAMAFALLFIAPLTVNAEEESGVRQVTWYQNATGWWVQFEDGTYPTSQWFDAVNEDGTISATYYFKADGYMATGWTKIEGDWYLFGSNGAQVIGWQQLNGNWYYLGDSTGYAGYMREGTQAVDDVLYHFNVEAGNMVANGWGYDSEQGLWYLANPDGSLITGWQYIGGAWYYLDPVEVIGETAYYDSRTGHMFVDGWGETADGIRYYFKENGEMVTGWYNYANNYANYGAWVLCNADGSAYDGWALSGDQWYYVNKGDMVTNRVVALYQSAVDGHLYYSVSGRTNPKDTWVNQYRVGKDGAMVKGWYHDEYYNDNGYYDDDWYYTNPVDGSFYSGWLAYAGQWYYIDWNTGAMVRDGSILAGVTPEAPKAPSMEDYKNADGTYNYDAYYDAVGAYNTAVDAWETARDNYITNNTYVFGTDGAMVTGWYSFSGTYGTTWYYADPSGIGHDGWLYDGGNWYYLDHGRMLTNTFVDGGYYVGADGIWR